MRQHIDGNGQEYITLESFVKVQGLCETGGRAKQMIQQGHVYVNGHPETRRGRKLREHDVVTVGDDSNMLVVSFDGPPE